MRENFYSYFIILRGIFKTKDKISFLNLKNLLMLIS